MAGKNYLKGIVAGLAATLVLSALMLMKQMMGVMPQLDPIDMLTTMAGASTPAIGWIGHFLIGSVLWGILFVWLDPALPGTRHWAKGVVFGVGAWLMMMLAVMPMAGAGIFGLSLGMMAPIMTLVLHIIYGAVLGAIYAAEQPAARHPLQVSYRS